MGKYTCDEPLPIEKRTSISSDLKQAVQFTIAQNYFQSKKNIQILQIFVASQRTLESPPTSLMDLQ